MQKLARFGCLHGSVRNWNHAGQKVDLLFSGPKLAHFGPVYTGPDEFLHGRILYLDRLFTWDRANSVTDCSSVYMGPCKFWDQSRLCHDWFKLFFSANHVAADGLRQIQNGDFRQKFYLDWWTDVLNLLLHVVLDYIKKKKAKALTGSQWKASTKILRKSFLRSRTKRSNFPEVPTHEASTKSVSKTNKKGSSQWQSSRTKAIAAKIT